MRCYATSNLRCWRGVPKKLGTKPYRPLIDARSGESRLKPNALLHRLSHRRVTRRLACRQMFHSHDLMAMLKPYDAALMEAYAVNRAVNSVKNDTEECTGIRR